jgi:hypothetical protein
MVCSHENLEGLHNVKKLAIQEPCCHTVIAGYLLDDRLGKSSALFRFRRRGDGVIASPVCTVFVWPVIKL